MDNSECELAALHNDPQFLHAILKPSLFFVLQVILIVPL